MSKKIDINTPLGISHVYDKSTDETYVSFSYLEESEIDYFQLEYYDENRRKWLPFDGRNGIIERDRK